MCSDPDYNVEEADSTDCLYSYNNSVMDQYDMPKRLLLLLLTVLMVVLIALCYWWRFLANWFLYLEFIIRIVGAMIPNIVTQNETNLSLTMKFVAIFVCLYCDQPGHIIVTTLTLAIHCFVI